jgi:hypothetical protein
MLRSPALGLLVCSVCAAPVRAEPAQVLIIRHAEKPAKGHDLSLKGRERAAALVPYFLGTRKLLHYKASVAVYAQKSTKGHRSRRPVQTVQGLAAALDLKVIEYPHDDYAKMVADIRARPEYRGKTVLICWEHHGIPPLARAFGVQAPAKWPAKAFDRVWVLTFPPGGRPTFRDLPQRLLDGDSSD